MKRIYIALPYSYNPVEARKRVDKIVKEVYAQGYLPISPVHLFDWLDDDGDCREHLLNACADLLKQCDEIWVYGISDGVLFELEKAKEYGIKAEYKAND